LMARSEAERPFIKVQVSDLPAAVKDDKYSPNRMFQVREDHLVYAAALERFVLLWHDACPVLQCLSRG
jgi:hypothetical protein